MTSTSARARVESQPLLHPVGADETCEHGLDLREIEATAAEVGMHAGRCGLR
jgi:hypothetical protein